MFQDGIMESSGTLGTLDYELTGSVYNGRPFNEFFIDGQRCSYIVQTLTRSKYEIIDGAFQIGPPNKLLRTNVIQSSQAGAKVDWQPGDVYFIASYPSATVIDGLIKSTLALARPWWKLFGHWLRQNFPSTNIHTWNFFDGTVDIPIAQVNTVTHKIQWTNALPAGIILPTGGDTADPGFLLCDGASYLRSDYQALYNRIGTKYGSVDGTHFNVPNTHDRSLFGWNAGGAGLNGLDTRLMGAVGGTQNDPSQSLTFTGSTGTGTSGASGGPGNANSAGAGSYFTFAQDGHTHTIPSVTVSASGSTNAVSNIPPGLVVNFQITTGLPV